MHGLANSLYDRILFMCSLGAFGTISDGFLGLYGVFLCLSGQMIPVMTCVGLLAELSNYPGSDPHR